MSRPPTQPAYFGRQRPFRKVIAPLTFATAVLLAIVSCGRSSSTPVGPASSGPASATGKPSAAAAPGDFGSLKAVCGPGSASGATARGVTNTEIHIGVTADPGAAAAPGLEQEFFDTAAGFSKWCNAAGGINGRKIVVDKLDAKLFNVGQVMTNACQRDFFLVGNGNAFDSAGVKIRENCKLGQIPAYVVSPQAVDASYQVQPAPIPSDEINDGAMRLLAQAFPDTKTGGVAIASSTLTSIIPTGLKAQEYLKDLGIKVAVLQNQPVQIDNFRPYIEQLKLVGAKGLYQITSQDPNPVVQAMRNVGYNLDWILFSTQFYGPQAIQGAKSLGTFPPSYVQFAALPFELASKYPVLAQTQSIVKAAVSNPKLTSFTLSSFNAWLLFAESAKACGSNLTMDCVLKNAKNHTDWTAGGLYPPQNLVTGEASPCIALVKLTTDGFVYDQKVTAPTANDFPFNCDPQNVKKVKTYVTG
ncbi:MAG TPA: ABC transporter substrate-binding protein [Frankiaceae bacterium]|jgi:ABC-type branched-subunit amino acid transport system substrate-binding protein|nr:ABC transporter substrate-binding protein [Frankiaceae bacterium]